MADLTKYCIFAPMKTEINNEKWSENVIIADADYIDKVAFNLIVNFERMIGRRIQQADMAMWIDCVALDGGLREGKNSTQVILMHSKSKKALENFAPADYEKDLDGKAFSDKLGEFLISSLPVEDDIVDHENLFCDAMMHICNSEGVRRVMVIPDVEQYYDGVRRALREIDDEKTRVTVFAMQPMPGGNFRQEILGYSLLKALGVRADELYSI